MPMASVIIASHNRSAFLPRAVASAQAAGKDVQVIAARALVAGHFRAVQQNLLAALCLHPYASVRAAATNTRRFYYLALEGFSLADFDTGFMHDERTKGNR
jgi:hypothetical protein